MATQRFTEMSEEIFTLWCEYTEKDIQMEK